MRASILGLLIELHTALVFVGVLMIPLALRRARESAAHHRAALIAAASLGIIIVNYVLYLPYLTFEGWYWLRFMLPGLTVSFVLFASVVDWCRLQIAARSRIAATFMVAPISSSRGIRSRSCEPSSPATTWHCGSR